MGFSALAGAAGCAIAGAFGISGAEVLADTMSAREKVVNSRVDICEPISTCCVDEFVVKPSVFVKNLEDRSRNR